jgi:diacylglycerol kinase
MKKIKRLCSSFANAYRGLLYVVEKEQNFRIELIAGIAIITTMIILQVERWEAVVLLFAIGGVLVLEMINTLVERIVNIFKPRMHPHARVVKDIMASAVFIASIGAGVIGIIIFWPYIFG